ncbi:MAG TPA: sterol desaturase family protein [Chitinophagaceae bacterium]|nr:sterol desaturase family protein [Chitinophagaceae bacterium]
MRFYEFYISRYENAVRQLKCIFLFSVLFAIFLVPAEIFIRNQALYVCILFVAGWFLWTFTEYILHRFWMHGRGHAGKYHSYHHTHPTEIKVTQLQRTILVIIVTAIGIVGIRIHPYVMVFDGFIFGFAAYCCMHWVLHQSWSRKLFPRLHRFHIYHHCKFPDSCYGVTVSWWDLIFRTIPPAEAKLSNKIISFYYGNRRTVKKTSGI